MFFGGLMMLGFFVFTVLLVVLVVLWIPRLEGPVSRWPHEDERWMPPEGDRSFDIVRERYARGDITLDEYHEYCRNLGRCGGL